MDNLPVSKPAPTFPPRPRHKRELPAGWWCIDTTHPGHKGNKSDAVCKIAADGRIPDPWRAAIVAAINDAQCSAIEVHAHAQSMNGELILSIHIKPLF